MNVLVDTSTWSLLLRREPDSLSTVEFRRRRRLQDLLTSWSVGLIGPIRQEVLSGIARPEMFQQVRDSLAEFADEPVPSTDYVRAAEMYNQCQARGVQPTHTDMLLCAVAERLGWSVFTEDRDFVAYSDVIGVRLLDV